MDKDIKLKNGSIDEAHMKNLCKHKLKLLLQE